MARTDFAPGACTAPKAGLLSLDPGPTCGKGGFIRSFVIFLFFLCFRDTKLITLFLILVGSLFSVGLGEVGRGAKGREDEVRRV